MLMLANIFGGHKEGHAASIQLYMMQWSLDSVLRKLTGLQISLNNIPNYTREHYNDSIIYDCAAIILCGSSHSTIHCNVKYIQ